MTASIGVATLAVIAALGVGFALVLAYLIARDRRTTDTESGDEDVSFSEATRGQLSSRDALATGGAMATTFGLAHVAEHGIGGLIYAWFYQATNIVLNFGAMILAPFQAIAQGVAGFISSTFGITGFIVEESGKETAMSITGDGAWAIFGPGTFTIGVAASVGGIAVLLLFVRRTDWRPWKLLMGGRRR